MAEIQESIEVEVPVQTAYNQWTQFEDFPKFMESSRLRLAAGEEGPGALQGVHRRPWRGDRRLAR
jgi:hypothetical protein